MGVGAVLLVVTSFFQLQAGSQAVQQALQQFQNGDTAAAERSLHAWLQVAPQDAPAHNLLGLVLLRESHYPEAAQQFSLAIKLQPGYAAAQTNLGNTFVLLHHDGQARGAFEQAIRLRPDDPLALQGIGLLEARAGNDLKAEGYLASAHRLRPSDRKTTAALAAAYLDLKRFDKAGDLASQLGGADPGENDARMALASLALEKGDPATARRFVLGNTTLEQSYSALALQKASSLAEHRDYAGMLKMLQSAAQPGVATYENLLGLAYAGLDQPTPAAEHLQEAIRLSPGTADFYWDLGFLFLRHQTGDGAALVFTAGTRALPNAARLWVGLGLSHFIQGDARTAKENLYHALTIDPRNVAAYVVLLDLLSQTGTDQEVLTLVVKAQAVVPGNSMILYYYGKSLARQSNPAALAQLKQSIAADPHFAPAYYELGRLQNTTGATSDAIAALTRCLQIDPKMAEAHYALFQIYHRIHRDDLGSAQLTAFQELRKKYGDEEHVQRLLFTVDK